MELAGCELVADYLRMVLGNAEEADALYRDLLVEVTSFFRDEDAFQKMRDEIVPVIVASGPSHHPIRVWVPGCATGRRGVFIGDVDGQRVQRTKSQRDVRIFATDLHEDSLKHASTGLYTHQSVSSIPKELLDKYLQRQGDMYAICSEIRRMVNFTVHDLTEDPPFTRLDLVCCRNVVDLL